MTAAINGTLLLLLFAILGGAFCAWHSPAALCWLLIQCHTRLEMIPRIRQQREERISETKLRREEWRAKLEDVTLREGWRRAEARR